MLLSELDFGVNNFGKQRVLSPSKTIAQLILNILLMRPGQMPSMPHIGINIKKYLYKFDDELDVEDLRQEIVFQCSEVIPFVDTTQMVLSVVEYRGESLLMIVIPLLIDSETVNLLYGFKENRGDAVQFNMQVEELGQIYNS